MILAQREDVPRYYFKDFSYCSYIKKKKTCNQVKGRWQQMRGMHGAEKPSASLLQWHLDSGHSTCCQTADTVQKVRMTFFTPYFRSCQNVCVLRIRKAEMDVTGLHDSAQFFLIFLSTHNRRKQHSSGRDPGVCPPLRPQLTDYPKWTYASL